MIEEEAYSAYLSGFQPDLHEHVSTHMRGNLEEAIAMAQRLQEYSGNSSSGPRAGGQEK